jgi:uncharacterized protein (DUF2147 family)
MSANVNLLSKMLLVMLACLVGSGGAWAQAQPVAAGLVGLWKTFDDDGKNERALVRITEADGVFSGEFVKNLEPGADPNELCSKCIGEGQDKPLVGLRILKGLKMEGGEYRGGEILDPETGTVYRCTMRLADDGRKLVVNGYVGIALFGRTQEWVRAD